MTDTSALQLHRARRQIDADIEFTSRMITAGLSSGVSSGMLQHLKGVVMGLQKARILLFTPEESAESWRVRKEMFG